MWFFSFQSQNWWKNPSSTLRGLGGVTTSRHHFHAPPGYLDQLNTCMKPICIRRMRLCLNDGFWPTYEQEHVKFWATSGDICFVQVDNGSGCWGFDVCFYTKTIQVSWPYPNGLVSLHKSLRQRPYHWRKISIASIFAQVNEEEFLRIMKKTNLFWGPGDSSQQHQKFFVGDTSSGPSSHFYSLSIHIMYKYENTWKYVLYCDFAWIHLPTQKLNPKSFLSQKKSRLHVCSIYGWRHSLSLFEQCSQTDVAVVSLISHERQGFGSIDPTVSVDFRWEP